MTEREQQWAAYRAWNKDFRGPIYFHNWDQWIAEYGFAVWQASRRSALEEAAKVATVKLNGLTDVANAIRALSQKTAQGETNG